MSFGIPGSISIFPRAIPPAAATVTGANNGTSLSGTTVQFGQDVGAIGDPAVLLNDREIPLNGFGFSFGIPGDRRLVVDQINNAYALGDYDGSNAGAVVIDGATFTSNIYAIDGGTTTSQFLSKADSGGGVVGVDMATTDTINQLRYSLDLVAVTASLNFGMGVPVPYMLFDFINTLYQFGDITAVNLGTRFDIDDAAGNFNFENAAMNAVINMNGVAGFTGTVTPVNSITVNGGIVTAVS